MSINSNTSPQTGLTTSSSFLKAQLQSMCFQDTLIQQALQRTNNLEQAIEIIISIMEQRDSEQRCKSDSPTLLLLVRIDLKMGLGKVAAQCAHATLRAYQNARRKAFNDEKYSLTFISWLESGQQKVPYRVQSEGELFQLLDTFKTMGVETCHIRDAGRTQISAGTSTVGAVGPFSARAMEAVSRKLTKF